MNNHSIQGVILAGGSGQRLRLDPISNPKPLVRVGSMPLIVSTIEYLQQLGIEDIWIVVGHDGHGDQIQKEIIGNKLIQSRTHLLRLPFQPQSMVQTLVHAISDISGHLMVFPCDLIFENYPLRPSGIESIESDKIKIIAAAIEGKSHSSEEQSSLKIKRKTNNDLKIINMGINIPDANYRDTGIYVIGEDARKHLKSNLRLATQIEDFYQFIEEMLKLKKAEIKYIEPGEWFDVNTPVDKIRAELFIKRQQENRIGKPDTKIEKTNIPLKNSYDFTYSRKNTTEIVIQTDILNELWEYDIIPSTNARSPHYLVTDSDLYNIIGRKIEKGFTSKGYDMKSIIVPVGEDAKKIDEFWNLVLEALAQGLDRRSIMLSLGGGSINNVAGLAASTLFRGIDLYHIPTTLLAQLDSTIDIKHAINTPYGKNLVGSFYAADKVIVDPAILSFLSEDHIINGLSESIKHGLVQDKGLLDYFYQYEGDISDSIFLEKIIDWTIKLKVECMSGKPDGGLEDAIKDYGHGIAHALEQYSGYKIHHGPAISMGMCISAEIARVLNATTDKEVDMHYRIFKKYNLPTSISPDFNLDDLELVQKHDKTYMQGKVYMGLILELGKLWNKDGKYSIPVDIEILRQALKINQEKFSI